MSVKYEKQRQERIARLPKWAQQDIGRLEQDKARYKKAALEMEGGESNVYQRDYSLPPGSRDRRAIKRDSHIIFVTKDAEYDVGFRNGELEVSIGAMSKATRIVVMPRSSNIIIIGSTG